MEDRERRIGENEALFREVNRRIVDLNQGFGDPRPTVQILCECGRRDCLERLEISVDDYREVRADKTTFAVKPGHELPDVESVVRAADAFLVVRKREGTPADLARAT